MKYFPTIPSDLATRLKFKRVNQRKCWVHNDDNLQVLKSYDTLVAVFDKQSGILFLDSENYSSYTTVHIGFFMVNILKKPILKTIDMPQNCLVNITNSLLDKEKINITSALLFEPGNLAKIYRLRNICNQIVKIVKNGNYYDFINFNNGTYTISPKYYVASFLNDDSNTYHFRPRNLKDWKGGI